MTVHGSTINSPNNFLPCDIVENSLFLEIIYMRKIPFAMTMSLLDSKIKDNFTEGKFSAQKKATKVYNFQHPAMQLQQY